ncbi:hypothetical protein MJO28_002251 [Puccinia striiformis f. sp. tritici]|uniref:Uncharacterized protein n=1 Tax=Puccinia striiformis f. sp. tritici TaxID=168172 RepID=A0ACC0EWB6_9BASI|nr:hypothetical protein MJO28_002251 [Puccinia striiformis f. sp. tritici]
MASKAGLDGHWMQPSEPALVAVSHHTNDRGGTAESNQRKGDPREPKVTRLCNCPFAATLHYQSQDKHWKFLVKEHRHDHPPSGSPAAHTANWKLSARLFKEMNQLSDAGLKPARILDALKKLHPDEMTPNKNPPIFLALIPSAAFG